jgi:ABC-2 type transport system permease protein
MRPLLLFGVLYVVFTQFIRIGGKVPHYPLLLLTGIVLFTFLSEATSGSVACVVDREVLVRKIRFPRLAIPFSVVLTSFFNLMLNLVVVFIFLFATGGNITVTWLELPLILFALVALASGISMLLSSLYVRYRDIRPIWDVSLQTLFYGSPVLYPIESIPNHTLQQLMMLNPFAVIIQQARHALIDHGAPTASAAAGGAVYLLIPTAILLGLLVLGYIVFDRRAPKIAEEI